jgi:hypothetical protein
MFNCKKVSEMVSQSMDRKFPLHRRILITMHLLMCRYCNRFKKQLMLLRAAVGLEEAHEADIGPSPALPNETRERIKQAMRDLLPDPDPNSLNT